MTYLLISHSKELANTEQFFTLLCFGFSVTINTRFSQHTSA